MSSNSWFRGAHANASIWPISVWARPTTRQQIRSLTSKSYILESSAATGCKVMPQSSLPCSIAGQRAHSSYSTSKAYLESPTMSKENISSLISRNQAPGRRERLTSHSPESRSQLRSEADAWKELKRRAMTQWQNAKAP
jgi:hypothetical protein